MGLVCFEGVWLTSCGLVLGGCGTSGASHDSTAPPCTPFVSTADLSEPASFAADVAPVFAQHCATGGGRCHGDIVTLPFLGLPEASADPTTVLANLVGVASGENPSMPFVSPSDPSNSYLMFKMDGDQCTLSQACDAGPFHVEFPNCGATMPFLSPQLPVETRDVVRRWIAQGAQND